MGGWSAGSGIAWEIDSGFRRQPQPVYESFLILFAWS